MACTFILCADPASPRFWLIRRGMLRCLAEHLGWQAAGVVSHRQISLEDIGVARGQGVISTLDSRHSSWPPNTSSNGASATSRSSAGAGTGVANSASGAWREVCAKAGLAVPREVAIFGGDNDGFIRGNTDPPGPAAGGSTGETDTVLRRRALSRPAPPSR
ncbi:MAG: hypothetical protein BWZ02_01177 [Lentisphaerae bacterium ADurb.BinA184]|nr:MAG: hypothetical protein BWZ02_01177 [Lentisphaerae bacterium ADurb.BinA184]